MCGLKSASDSSRPARDDWEGELARFATTPSGLVRSRALLRRADTKFVVKGNTALDVLRTLSGDYTVLPAGGALTATYRTLYFDTPGLDFFHRHRCGRRLRHKVRIRGYPERNVAFLEIKKRINSLQQRKFRVERELGNDALDDSDLPFIREHTGEVRELLPTAWMTFYRITLLHTSVNERLTVDFGLSLATKSGSVAVPGFAVVETKQWPFSRRTAVMQALRARGCRPHSFSKYCATLLLTCPGIRGNRLLPRLRILKGGVI
jgi:hypothetical protein